jgi:hypothetical protein
MKKIIFASISFCLLLALGSCKKLVEEQPLSDGTLDNFYKNKYDADAAMAAMYGQLQQQLVGDGQFKNRFTYWGEGRSDNFESTPGTGNTASVREMHYNALTANNDYADWTGLYRAIGMANLNIDKFPQINTFAAGSPKDQLDIPTLNSYMAQSYAMRALCYFYIVRIWGDAPLRITPYLDAKEDAYQARDPQSKILDQIVADLTKAYSLIPKGAAAPVWYIGEGAICAILADVYMWRHDYDNAIVWFKNEWKSKGPTGKVYNAAGANATGAGGLATDLEPTATWKNVFVNPTGSVEAIWNINWDVSANGCPCMSGVSTTVNNIPLRISTEIFTSAWAKSTVDIRPKQTFDVTKKEMDRTWKYYPGSFGANGPAGSYTGTYGTNLNVYITMYRLADQYLLYAEALNKKGDFTNALKYLNLIHVRAGLPAYTASQFTTDVAMEDAILQERQWELFAEGKRWFDLVRTDHVYQVMDPIMINRQNFQGAAPVGFGPDKSDKRKYLWPLHRNVLNANSLLVQNPPYTD